MTVQDLPEKVRDFLRFSQNQHRAGQDERLYPTELLGCLKKAYLCRKNKCDMELEGCYAVWRGKLFDDALSPLFERQQESVTYEIPDTPITIAGRLDAVDPNGQMILDWKTVSSLYYIRAEGPKDSHKRQLMFYWSGIRAKNPEDPVVQLHDKKGMIKLVYMDMGGVETYLVGFTSKEADDNLMWLTARAKVLYDALKENVPPKVCAKDSKREAWECKYCSARKMCEELP
jgi:hypothetical protein